MIAQKSAAQPQSDSQEPPNFNALISVVLIAGVSSSAVILGFGLLLFFIQGGATTSVAAMFSASPHGLMDTLRLVFSGVVHGDPVSIVDLGVIVLLATPVLRVAASILLFLAEKDWLYTVLTVLVLTILLYSILAIH